LQAEGVPGYDIKENVRMEVERSCRRTEDRGQKTERIAPRSASHFALDIRRIYCTTMVKPRSVKRARHIVQRSGK
jgi:hypothetical protein